MLKHLIGSLRKKPVHVRQNVAFWGAVGFTAVVVSVWAYHLPARHQSLAVQQGADQAPDEPSGLSGIIDIIGDGFGGMQAALGSIEEESPSSTTIRAEQSLQAAIDEARSTSSARQSIVSSDTDVVGSAIGTSTPEAGVAATSSFATTTATTTSVVELPEPRPVRIVTTSATPTATSTTE
jgi:hypothetical protein